MAALSQKSSSVATTLTLSASTTRGSATALCVAGKSYRVGNDYQIRCPTSKHPPPSPTGGPGAAAPGELSPLSFAGKGPAGGMTSPPACARGRSKTQRTSAGGMTRPPGLRQGIIKTQYKNDFPPFGRARRDCFCVAVTRAEAREMVMPPAGVRRVLL